MIKQTANSYPEPKHMRHPVHGHLYVQPEDVTKQEELGYSKLIDPGWLYHKNCPDGEIFCSTAVEKLAGKGWVDTPAKINAPAVAPDEIMEAVCTIAEKLLDGGKFSQAALMRELGMNSSNSTKRIAFKPTYDKVFSEYQSRIKKIGPTWFWDLEVSTDAISLSEKLKASQQSD